MEEVVISNGDALGDPAPVELSTGFRTADESYTDELRIAMVDKMTSGKDSALEFDGVFAASNDDEIVGETEIKMVLGTGTGSTSTVVNMTTIDSDSRLADLADDATTRSETCETSEHMPKDD